MSLEYLQRSSEDTIEEVVPSGSSENPVIWRRGLHTVKLPLRDIELATEEKVHEVKTDPDKMDHEDPNQYDSVGLPVFEYSRDSSSWIDAIVDSERLEDTIQCLVLADNDRQVYRSEEFQGEILVTLRPGDPANQDEAQGAGTFVGRVFRGNPVTDADDLFFDLTMPADRIDAIIETLKSDEAEKLYCIVYLNSFVPEETDFHQELLKMVNLKPKNCLIEKEAKCLLKYIGISKPLLGA